jgi:POT family proton-dependent oligopeptide transporter
MTFGMIVYLRRLHWLSHVGQAPEADAPRPWIGLTLVTLGTAALLAVVMGTDQVITTLRNCEGDEIARAFARVAYAEDCKALLADWGLELTHRWFWCGIAAGVGLAFGLILYLRRRKRLSNIGRQSASDASLPWGGMVLFAFGMATLIGAVFGADQIVMTLKACKGEEVANVFARGAYGMICLGLPIMGIIFYGILRRDEDSRRIAAILVFFVCAILFWAVFEQAGSSLTLFAEELTRNELFGEAFPSSWFQSVNSLFILALAPLFAWLWVRLRERQPSIPMKFVWGLVFLGLSFALLVPAAKLTAAGKVSPWWLIAVYFLQTIGELCLSPVGLSAMTKLAPAKLAGLVMGTWFLGTALGNKLAGVVAAEFNAKDPLALADFFLTQVLIVGGFAVLLLVLVPWVRRLTGETAR